MVLRRYCLKKEAEYLGTNDPEKLARKIYYRQFHKELNLEDPQDLNEKIQWLKFRTDTTLWTQLSDKYRVREYVEKKGLGEILVPLYGHWDRMEDIDWEGLPNEFIMKVNNGSGDVLVCNDKNRLNIPKICEKYSKLLSKKFGLNFAEPHYNKIVPCIIFEKLLDIKKQPIESNSLIDYKIWCFSGKPECIWACYNRNPRTVEVGLYDLQWNYHPEKSIFTSHYQKSRNVLPKPKTLDRMLEIATILSDKFPEVRVDLYEVDGKVYFGEMTFTSQGGYMEFYTPEFLAEMGRKVTLPMWKNSLII